MPTFDPIQFKLDYSQFSTLTDNYLTSTYNYVASPFYQFVLNYFTDVNQQYYWSCIVLAHVLTLINSNNVGLINAVGRVLKGDTGDVTTALDKVDAGYGSDWWIQTRYGMQVWTLMEQNGGCTYISS